MRRSGIFTEVEHPSIVHETHTGEGGQAYEIIRCMASPVENVVDTTGAGDTFIGGMIYGESFIFS